AQFWPKNPSEVQISSKEGFEEEKKERKMPDLPPPASAHASACVEEHSVPPRFDVGRSRSGPAKILSPTRFSCHKSVVRPPFSTPLASGVSSSHR
ncbi:hypothetical protein TorRG33x02_329420, partial [Trema orientale]